MLTRLRPSLVASTAVALGLGLALTSFATPALATSGATRGESSTSLPSGAASKVDDDPAESADDAVDSPADVAAPAERPWVTINPSIAVGTGRLVYLPYIDATMSVAVRSAHVVTGCTSRTLVRVVLLYEDGITRQIPCPSVPRSSFTYRPASDAAVVGYWIGRFQDDPPPVGDALNPGGEVSATEAGAAPDPAMDTPDDEVAGGATAGEGASDDDLEAAGKDLLGWRETKPDISTYWFDEPLTVGRSGDFVSRYLGKTVSVEVVPEGFRVRCAGVAKIVVTDQNGVDFTARCRPDGLPMFHFRDSTAPITRVWVGPPTSGPAA